MPSRGGHGGPPLQVLMSRLCACCFRAESFLELRDRRSHFGFDLVVQLFALANLFKQACVSVLNVRDKPLLKLLQIFDCKIVGQAFIRGPDRYPLSYPPKNASCKSEAVRRSTLASNAGLTRPAAAAVQCVPAVLSNRGYARCIYTPPLVL